MKIYILLSIALLPFLVGCSKDPTPSDGNPNDPSSPPLNDPATGIVTVTSDGGYLISVFNINGTLRWKNKIVVGGGLSKATSYADGRLFFTLGDTLYAYNIQNGAVLWKKIYFGIISVPVPYKGAIYTATNADRLYEINPVNGELLKDPAPISQIVPAPPFIQDSVVYTITATNLAYYSIKAFDLKTRLIKWTLGLGYNPPQGLILADNFLVLRGAFSSSLSAINLKTGVIEWSRNDIEYSDYMISEKRIYAIAEAAPKKVYAIDLSTGSKIWEWQNDKINLGTQHLYQYLNQVTFIVFEPDLNVAKVSLNKTTGALLWKRDEIYRNLIFDSQKAGDKIFRFEILDSAPYNNQIFIYNAENFMPLDSMTVEGINFHHLRVIKKSEN